MRFAPKVYGCAIALTFALPTSIFTAITVVEPALAQEENALSVEPLEVNGVLDTDADTLDNGEYYNLHTFEGTEGQDVVIELVSEEFDTYLIVFGPEGNRVAENDDSEGSNARVRLTLPATGIYRVWATSYGAGEVGSYRLSWEEDKALAELQRALEVARERGNSDNELEALYDIADYYRSRESHLESIEYLQEMLGLAQTVDNEDYEIAAYQSIPASYISFVTRNNAEAYRLLDSEEIESAQQRLTESISTVEKAVPIIQRGLIRARDVQIEDLSSEEILTSLNLQLAQTHQGLGLAYQLMGNSYLKSQNLEEARQWAQKSIEIGQQALKPGQRALELAEESQNIFNILLANKVIASIYNGIIGDSYSVQAWAFLNEQSFQEEINALQQSLAARQLAVPFAVNSEDEYLQTLIQGNISNTYDRIGTAHRELGQYEESITAAQQALEIARQLGNQLLELNSLLGLDNTYYEAGGSYLESGDYDQALAAYEQSIFYSQERLRFTQSPQFLEFEHEFTSRGFDPEQAALESMFTNYSGLRGVHTAQNDYESALEISHKKLEIAQQIENPEFEYSALSGLYVDYNRLSRYQEALSIAQQRLDRARQQNNPEKELATIVIIASIQQDLGDFPEAVEAYERALELAKAQNNQQIELSASNNLGTLYSSQGNFDQAISLYESTLLSQRNLRDQLQIAESVEQINEFCSYGRNSESFRSTIAPPELMGSEQSSDARVAENVRQLCIESSWDSEQKILGSIAAVYNIQGRYPDALKFHQESLVIIQEKVPDAAQEADALNAIGATYGHQGEYQKAFDYIEQALKIANDINHQPSIIASLTNVAQVYIFQGDYPNALSNFQAALDIVQTIELRPLESGLLNSIGQVYYFQGKYDQAIEARQQALLISQQLGQRIQEASVLSGLSVINLEQGDYDEALNYAQQSLNIYETIGALPSQPDLRALIGRINYIQGNYAQAIDTQQQAVDISQDIGDQDNEAYALQQLGITYSQIGQYNRALALNQRALEIAQGIGDRSREASTLDEIGNLHQQQGEYEQSLQHYAQALAIWQAIDSPVGEARSLRNAGFVKEQLGRYGEAQADFQQSLALQRQIRARGHEGLTLNGLALAHAAQGETPEALSALQQALTLHRELGDRPGQAKALSDLGNVYLQANRLTEAEGVLYEALDVLESLRASELKDTDKIALFDTQLEAYDTLQQVLIAQNDPAKALTALEVAERGRARAFVDSLTVRLADTSDIPGDITFPDLAEIRQIARQQNATLVEYAIVKANTEQPELYIWVISPTGDISFRQQSLQGVDLATLVQSTRSSLGVRSRATIEVVSNRRPTEEQLQQLHQLLIVPIADLLPADPEQRVIMIPQGDLFLVPFPALLNTEGQYLIEQHTLLTTPSIQVLDLTRQRRHQLGATRQGRSQTGDVLIVGNPEMPTVRIPSIDWQGPLDPLPGALEEAQKIATFFNTRAITGSAATEERIKQQMATPQILHLATHGLLEYGLPGESERRDLPGAIALTPGNGEDGLLTAAEIYDMNISAELVVLSACDTGRGRITGDGVVGLSRAFISAGTPSVVVSLWSVPDAPTADLMVAFYEQLQQGQDKAQALRQAMLQVMAQPGNEAPKNWAAFTLIGEAD